MSHEQSTPDELLKACLEASFYLSARDPGMTWDELREILAAVGVLRGEADDSIRAMTNRHDVVILPTGRLFYDEVPQVRVLDFLIPFEDDPRDRNAVAHLHRWILAIAKEKGTRNTRFGRSEVLAEAAERGFHERDVDFTLEVMTRLGLLEREMDDDMYHATEMLSKWAIIGAQTDMRVPVSRRPAFSKVLPYVEAAIAARSPDVKRTAMLSELAQVAFVPPNGDDARAVLQWIVQRFADTGAPVPLEDLYLAFPDVNAKSVAWHLESDTEYVRMYQQATNPSVVPTVWGASSTPELFVDAFILLDGALRRACEARMASKTRAPLIGSGGLLEARDSSKRVRDMAVLLAASLQPYLVTGNDLNASVQIHDEIRECDRLVKFLAWKAQAAQSARKPSEVRASETPGTANPQKPKHVVTSTAGVLSRMDAIELFRELDKELASVAEGPNHRADKFVAARETITTVADKGSLLLPAIPLRFDLASIWSYHDRGILPEDHGAPIGPFLRRLFHYQTATRRILSILCDDSLWSLHGKQDLVAVPTTSNPAVAAAVVDPSALKAQLELLGHFDVAIVCALHKPELEKVLQTGQGWTSLPASRSDPMSYEQTTFKSKRGAAIRVVAAAPNLMGLSASSVLATKMIMRFRPRLVAMVGIAAGVKNDKQNYGDILAAEHTFDYGSGKIAETTHGERFLPDHKPLDVDPRVLSRLRRWSADRTGLDAIRKSWPAKRPQTALDVHVGPLGSGAAVVSDASTIAGVLEHWRKLVGIEMEAYGVHRACRDTVQPQPLFLCLKSICDFAGSDKNDDWQDYAAFVSARFLFEFLTTDWEELFPD